MYSSTSSSLSFPNFDVYFKAVDISRLFIRETTELISSVAPSISVRL